MASARHTQTLYVVLLFAPFMQSAFGQTGQALAKAVTDPREQETVIGAAKLSDVIIDNPCEDAHYSIADEFSIYEPLVLDEAGGLRAGSWKQVIDYTGCGATRILNVLVRIIEGAPAKAYPLLPGTTHADPQLQVDVLKSPAMQAGLAHWREPACRRAYVAATEFENHESTILAGAKGPGWHEVWTVAACGRMKSIPVTFAPDSTGTTFSLALGPSAQDGPGKSANPP